MKWKSRVKRTATTTSAIILALMLAACSDNNSPVAPTATPNTEQTEQGSIPTDSLPEDTGVLDPGTLTPDGDDSSQAEGNNNSATDNETVSEVINADGIYSGAADGHSVEIQINNEYMVFQIDDSLTHIIDEYDSNQAVSIEYVEKTIDGMSEKQLWLKSIEKK